MDIAKTIYAQLKQLGGMKFWCWGATNFVGSEEERSLSFKVDGMKFKGYVTIVLNYMDTYDITFTNKKGDEVKEVNNVYFDGMVDVIDNYVEKIDAYAW
jgi:hypothetical protein